MAFKKWRTEKEEERDNAIQSGICPTCNPEHLLYDKGPIVHFCYTTGVWRLFVKTIDSYFDKESLIPDGTSTTVWFCPTCGKDFSNIYPDDYVKINKKLIDTEYSEEYKKIREEAENNWPEWKVKAYNISFATSAHARKIE